MATFQRAHSEEQRAVRRATILSTTAEMLSEMPVSAVSLNELSRRAGLAKSNVLRYFPSREAILLSLLTSESEELLDSLSTRLAKPGDRRRSAIRRSELVADALVDELIERPVLCDLLSAQAAVLERNVTTEVAATFKHRAVGQIQRAGELVHRQLPELDPPTCIKFVATALLQVGTVWPHSQPSPAVEAVYRTHPELAVLRMEFGETMRDLIVTVAAGLLTLSRSR